MWSRISSEGIPSTSSRDGFAGGYGVVGVVVDLSRAHVRLDDVSSRLRWNLGRYGLRPNHHWLFSFNVSSKTGQPQLGMGSVGDKRRSKAFEGPEAHKGERPDVLELPRVRQVDWETLIRLEEMLSFLSSDLLAMQIPWLRPVLPDIIVGAMEEELAPVPWDDPSLCGESRIPACFSVGPIVRRRNQWNVVNQALWTRLLLIHRVPDSSIQSPAISLRPLHHISCICLAALEWPDGHLFAMASFWDQDAEDAEVSCPSVN
ncbi:hypothetical protein R3P38DRAFT_228363 [Favolaschia claudopus]|uniref:Uncharacterized protein n=1 Tax=Favolaschia claudopus TaxID=2862362 RepID=A0AAV9ZS11_9AGAR